jgi:multisubunit Na+/H+ antiporter MnhB subunit
MANFPINIDYLGQYPDFVAFFICCIGIILMIIGVKESGFLNKFMAVFNVALLLFITLIGATRVDISNWNLKPNVSKYFCFS